MKKKRSFFFPRHTRQKESETKDGPLFRYSQDPMNVRYTVLQIQQTLSNSIVHEEDEAVVSWGGGAAHVQR